MVKEVIANNEYTITYSDDFMEVMEDEKAREEKPRTPEWIRNPGVQVEVIRGWRIVSNHRGAVPVVVIVDHRGLDVLRTYRGWIFGVLPGRMGHHR